MISNLPTACFAPKLFKDSIIFAGLIFFPLIAIGSPSKNSISISSALSGALCGAAVHLHISSGGEAHGSSKIFPSYDI